MQYQYMKSNVGNKNKIIREILTDPGLIILYKVTAHEWNILYNQEFQIKTKTTFDRKWNQRQF